MLETCSLAMMRSSYMPILQRGGKALLHDAVLP